MFGAYSLPKRRVLGTELFIQIPGFLECELAEQAHKELLLESPFTKVAGLGFLKVNPHMAIPRHVKICCDILTSLELAGWLSGLTGEEVRPVRLPGLFRMEGGDRILVHDDVSHSPLSRFSVVLHLSKNWKRQYGGNTVVGVARKTTTFMTEHGPMQQWIFGNKRSVLSPKFNSITVLRLRSGLAHGVTPIVGPQPRLSIVEHYEAVQATNTKD